MKGTRVMLRKGQSPKSILKVEREREREREWSCLVCVYVESKRSLWFWCQLVLSLLVSEGRTNEKRK